ncbi:hypothetical protein B0H11DRAFT_802856 [Mycena galericulata]|nr:hypothetical protein B0H11DRAFT_802856 [Mycena galericulata]
MPKSPTRKSDKKRARYDFTPTEDEKLVKFLSEHAPSARTNIATYRELSAQPWGSKHSAESWLGRYKRRRRVYDAQIDELVAESASEESMNEDELEVPEQLAPASDDQRTFKNLHIPFAAFKDRLQPVSETDQFLCLNLAINLLSATHGFDPEVVYETWKLTGDLHLTDEHLRQTAIFLDSGEKGEDEESDEEALSTSHHPNAVENTNFGNEGMDGQMDGRAQRPELTVDFVLSSIPEEMEIPLPSRQGGQIIQPAGRRSRESGPGIPEAPHNDEGSESESESESESNSDSESESKAASESESEAGAQSESIQENEGLQHPSYIQTQASLFGSRYLSPSS